MSTETERHELYEIAKHEVSDRFAELMMMSLPPAPDRLATKDDLAVLGADLRTEMSTLGADLRTEMTHLRVELKNEVADLRTEFKTDMADLRTDFKTDMADLRTDFKTDMAGLRTEFKTEIHTAFAAQTRTMVIGLVSAVLLIALSNALAVLAG